MNRHRLIVGVGADIQIRMSEWYLSQEHEQSEKIILDGKMRYRIKTIKSYLEKIRDFILGENYKIDYKTDRIVADRLSHQYEKAVKKINKRKQIVVEDEDWNYIMTMFVYLDKAKEYIEKSKDVDKELRKYIKTCITHFDSYTEYLENC